MSALNGKERKQAMDAITKAIDDFLKSKAGDFDFAEYRPDLAMAAGSRDWDVKSPISGTIFANEDDEDGRRFTLKVTKMVADGEKYSSYKLGDGAEFAWK